MMSYFYGHGWMMIMAPLYWIGIVLIVVYLLKKDDPKTNSDVSIEILKKRYAQGKIDKEIFETKLKELKGA